MSKESGRLTVFFEEPFWVGVFERTENGKLYAARVVFGAEPKDGEVYQFVQKHYYHLSFSPPVEALEKTKKYNPKKRQRNTREKTGIGTKSQQALKLAQEQTKMKRKKQTQAQRRADEARAFAIKQQKKREKKRGH